MLKVWRSSLGKCGWYFPSLELKDGFGGCCWTVIMVTLLLYLFFLIIYVYLNTKDYVPRIRWTNYVQDLYDLEWPIVMYIYLASLKCHEKELALKFWWPICGSVCVWRHLYQRFRHCLTLMGAISHDGGHRATSPHSIQP